MSLKATKYIEDMMIDRALAILAQADTDALVKFLDRQEHPLIVARTYSELVKHLYWQDKNIPDMIVLAQAGIEYALHYAAIAAQEDLSAARELRSEAKAIAYNLASFTWIGWDEPGITVTRTDQRFGLEAAKLNLRLAFELDKGDLRISRAYWMKAAQHLAIGDLLTAQHDFEKAAVYATRAGGKGDKLVAQAFVLLVEILMNPGDAVLEAQLASINAQFPGVEHGQMYDEQITIARRVFSRGART